MESSDFNGILISDFSSKQGIPVDKSKKIISALVTEGKVTLAFESTAVNPHIKRLPDLPIQKQLNKLKTEKSDTICAYPSAAVILNSKDMSTYDNKPFTKRLALAEAQLTPVFFELEVLEKYFRDPRYIFEYNDRGGSISIYSEHHFKEKDKIFIKNFGIGYDSNTNRVVVVYLRYLTRLSPEHQQIWNAHIVSDECTINGDYERAAVYGAFPQYHSAYKALLTEQVEINKLARLLGKPDFFNKTYDYTRPEGFFPLLRPTQNNFHDFILLLEKMLPGNINRNFFKDDIDVKDKGTIQLYEEWLSAKYRDANGRDISNDEAKFLRDIRRLRQKPAHKIEENKYDYDFIKQQDEYVGKAVHFLTKLRLILSSHPKARGNYSPPEWLDGDKIVFY